MPPSRPSLVIPRPVRARPHHQCPRRSALIVAVMCCGLGAASGHAQQPPQPRPGQVAPAPGVPQAPGMAPQQPAVPPPMQQQPPALTPQQQAELDQLLAAWEARNATIKTWSCRFTKWEYNTFSPVDANRIPTPFSESKGELKYAAPDKGLFRIRETKQWKPGTDQQPGRYEPLPGDVGEHWVCNGTSIYQFRHVEKQLCETKLPPEMQGKAISDGPLPFVFGAKAETLKKRYWMRIITPQNVQGQIWLEARPRFQADAANFSKVELILLARDLMPFAIQIYKPGGKDRDVYQFDPATNIFDRGLDMLRDFSRPATPLGYRYILEDQQGPPPGPPAPPGAAQPPGLRPPVPANLPR